MLLALAAPVSVVAYTIIDAGDQTGNGWTDTWTLDDNGDGRVDRLVVDANEDGRVEATVVVDVNGRITGIWLDSNLDHFNDTVYVPQYANGGTGAFVANILWRDVEQNGLFENAYWDAARDGYFEWVMVDTNFDGTADTWRPNSAPAGQSATDVHARQVASISAVNILHQVGIPVFYPSTTIPLGG
jgi:hypothetical protein